MKFIDYLSSISGVAIFPLISLLVFFIFFVLLGFYVIKADKTQMNYLASLPIDENSSENDSESQI
ncbi:MAG: CcoQ/FixQ family Cbb3-type cytochrome c oxidase assembly chaperone [Bacteroidetes bacterium]|jgi:cbb3-type cytochrome oxidase subunit 3|nr:CcoQ/FixQ family Cbb3-type cytochrome c oxidase assembly chaperone [Bacteroidota bacterium]